MTSREVICCYCKHQSREFFRADNSLLTGNEEVFYTRGLELISRRTNGEVQYYLFDGGSSVRGLTDEDGVITDIYLWDAFGNSEGHTGTSFNEYGFQGEQQDETGLYYLRARYMNPATGTFTSMDTYGGSLSDPMSLHKYMFANSNPVKYCDPSGHFTLVETMAVSAIVSSLEYGVLYCIAINTDEKYGTDFHSKFSWERFIIVLGQSLILGAIGYGISSLYINPILNSSFGELSGLWLLYVQSQAILNMLLIGIVFIIIGCGLERNESTKWLAKVMFGIGNVVVSLSTGGIISSVGISEGVSILAENSTSFGVDIVHEISGMEE